MIKRFFQELLNVDYLFLDGPYRLKKWGLDCKKFIKYKQMKIK